MTLNAFCKNIIKKKCIQNLKWKAFISRSQKYEKIKIKKLSNKYIIANHW